MRRHMVWCPRGDRLTTDSPYLALDAVSAETAGSIRNEMALKFCKWDPQVGDAATLSPFPLLLERCHWAFLFETAEQLTSELIAAEGEIVGNAELLGELGLPRPIQRLLSMASEHHRAIEAPRVMRFDFHFTTEGWKLSEVNSDVPGGFCESTAFTELMADRFKQYRKTGAPAHVLADKIHKMATEGRRIAFVAAPGLMEDCQVVAYLASCLKPLGWETHLTDPARITWIARRAHLRSATDLLPVDVIYRFYQGEWQPLLPRQVEWQCYFGNSVTPVINTGLSMISESKRLPLVWDRLSCPMTTWRRLLPETRAVQKVPWKSDESWLLKAAYSNGRETVSIREFLSARDWARVTWRVRTSPNSWVAQKRFVAVPLRTPERPLFPCIGVYTIDGVATGIYARLAVRPWIDYSAIDVAVLTERDPG
jgi:glutathionylspermidine synthase